MRTFLKAPARKGDRRAAAAALIAWLALLLLVAAALGALTLHNAAANDLAARYTVHPIDVTALNQATLHAMPCGHPMQINMENAK